MFRQRIMSIMTVLAAAALLLVPVQTARAALIPITLSASPSISTDHLDVYYNAGTLTLDNGFSEDRDMQLIEGGSSEPVTHIETDISGGVTISPGKFTIQATVDNDGILSGGSLTILGRVDNRFESGTLLTGNLVDFGFDPSDDILEFVFTNLGGDAAGLFGDQFGVRLTNTDVPGSFTSDFDNRDQIDIIIAQFPQPGTGMGQAISGVPAVTVVPEPGSLLLISTGLLGLVGLRRNR